MEFFFWGEISCIFDRRRTFEKQYDPRIGRAVRGKPACLRSSNAILTGARRQFELHRAADSLVLLGLRDHGHPRWAVDRAPADSTSAPQRNINFRSTSIEALYIYIASKKRPELRSLTLGDGEVFRGRLTDEYWTTKYELYHNSKQLTRK